MIEDLKGQSNRLHSTYQDVNRVIQSLEQESESLQNEYSTSYQLLQEVFLRDSISMYRNEQYMKKRNKVYRVIYQSEKYNVERKKEEPVFLAYKSFSLKYVVY